MKLTVKQLRGIIQEVSSKARPSLQGREAVKRFMRLKEKIVNKDNFWDSADEFLSWLSNQNEIRHVFDTWVGEMERFFNSHDDVEVFDLERDSRCKKAEIGFLKACEGS